MPQHIFISYSKQDIEFARYLKLLLEQQDFPVWIDERGIDPSDDWWETIERNIMDSVALVVIMTPSARDSKWIKRELLLAENENKPLFPVLLSGKIWSRLADIQSIDMTAGLRATLPSAFVDRLRAVIKPSPRSLELDVIEGDVLRIEADVAAFKYARGFHGADEVVAMALVEKGIPAEELTPADGKHNLVETGGAMGVERVLYVGTPRLGQVKYKEVRQLAVDVLGILATDAPETVHLAMTIHGPGFGLDETESLLSQVGGYVDAMVLNALPTALEKITIVERDPGRVARLRQALKDARAAGISYIQSDGNTFRLILPAPDTEEFTPAPDEAGEDIKPHAYIAITRNSDTDDLYYYGIQTAVHANGLLCECIDDRPLTNETLAQIKKRIDTASVVIAELSDGSPTVYLQIGYAWGKKRPTIILAKDAQSVAFDTKGQTCINYQRIKQLEENLSEELKVLASKKR